MGQLYVIELINRKGEGGYIIQRPDGISLATGGLTADVSQFKTYEKAEKFVRKMKSLLRKKKMKVFIRSMEYLMENNVKGIHSPDKDVYYLENEQGHKLCYDPKQEGYYFDDVEAGYPCWETEEQMKEFVKQAGFKGKTFIKTISPKSKQ